MQEIVKDIFEKNNIALKSLFKGRIKGYFLIGVKEQVLKALGYENLNRYYDFSFSGERLIMGYGTAAEYDICRIIVGIHKAKSIFLSDNDIRKNERSKIYKQQLVCETIEKIKIRIYASAHFRRKTLLRGEEFLYYPLPYELFAMSIKMNVMLADGHNCNCYQLYYGVVYNSISALTLLEDNLLGAAYPLCRGAIEMYFKLLLLKSHSEIYYWYERFKEFEIKYACCQQYPEDFEQLFMKRNCQHSKGKAGFLHFGWVDRIDGYHKVVKNSAYSVSGIITFLKNRNMDKNLCLEDLAKLYKSCHAYTHGSIQTARYPVLHYFEVSIMLYLIIRQTFIFLCEEKEVETEIEGQNIISMLDRDFIVLSNQYQIRSTENFEKYYNYDSSGYSK